jgi:predicted dehydrogenase
MIRIGLLGAGHLGKIHLKCLQNIPLFEIAGFYDPAPQAVAQAKVQFAVHAYDSAGELIADADALIIASPTRTHFQLAREAITLGKHLFIEKPAAETPGEVAELKELAGKMGCKVQVGHVERFNPAFLALKDIALEPRFVEGHRLAQFNPRGTDVSVIQDLMIHDLDILLYLIPSNVKQVWASGVPVVSPTPDICNARIEFANGSIANLTASRISMKKLRKMRLFQEDAYISMDFLEKTVELVQIFDSEQTAGMDLSEVVHFDLEVQDQSKTIILTTPDCPENNAIEMELKTFGSAIIDDTEPVVSLVHAERALELAQMIANSVEDSLDKIRE